MAGPEYREWLVNEVANWERDGVITPEQSRTIVGRYPAQTAGGKSWGMIIFSCLGAVIVGLGIILLLAYNWEAIPKYAKLAIIIGSLAAIQTGGIKLVVGSERFRALGEGICLLGTMVFGAGIWLVAQIYHIDEHFPNAFLIWGLGALAMALAMPSIPQAILATVLLTVWSGAERMEFDTPVWITPVVLLVLVGTLAWRLRSRLLLAVLLPAILFAYGFSMPTGGDHDWVIFSTYLSIASLYLALSYITRGATSFPGAAPVFWWYGGVMFIFSLFLLSFPSMAREVLVWHHREANWRHYTYGLIPLAASLAAWAVAAWLYVSGRISRQLGDAGFEIFLIPLTVILGVVDMLVVHRVAGWIVAGPFNLVFIGIVASMMARGCREGLMKQTVIGSVLLVCLIVARYFDLFESQLVRGVVFVVTGGLLIAEGILYSRAKRQKAEGGLQ